MPWNRLSAPLLASLTLLVALFAATGASAAPHGKTSLSDRVAVGDGKTQARAARVARAAAQAPRTTTAPAPAPAPVAAPPSDLLFDGSRIANFSRLEAAPGAITEVPDPLGSGETVFQLNVEEDDVYPVTPTSNPRAQALSPTIVNNGDEIWLQTKFMLPQSLPTVNGWMSLLAIYGAPYKGPGPWELEASGNEIRWMRNGTYGWDVPWKMPLVKGRWITVLLHERFASDGWVEMWIDGQQVNFFGNDPRLEMQTMDSSNNGGANEAKIMQYRKAGMFNSTAQVYFGPLKVGKTRTAVGG